MSVFSPHSVLAVAISEHFTPSDKFNSLKIIVGFWMKLLSPGEFQVIMFIWYRTIFWGKSREYIGFRHFMNGIPDFSNGVSISRRALTTHLASLENKGFLIRTITTGGGSFYKLNLANYIPLPEGWDDELDQDSA